MTTKHFHACAVALACWLAAGSASAQPVADWQFQGTLMDSVGAPALTPLITSDGAFVAEAVGGDAARIVRTFAAGGGFQVPATGLIADSGYTVAMLTRLDNTASFFKVFDTRARSSDAGLYVVGSNLRLYPLQGGESGVFGAGEWHQWVFTRDGNGGVRGYIDGDLQFIAVDSADVSTILQPEDVLTFLADDLVTTGEDDAGAVARIRLWNQPLNAVQIRRIGDHQGPRIFADGVEPL